MKKILILLFVFSIQIFSHSFEKKVNDHTEFPGDNSYTTFYHKTFQSKDAIQVSENDLKKYEGVYKFAQGNEMKIYLKDSTLRALLAGQPEYTLMPVAENEFKLKGMEGFKMIFKLDDNKKVISVTSSQPNGDFTAEKISDEVMPPKETKTITLSEDQLKKFEGEYEFTNGNSMKIYIKDGELKAFLMGQPEYTLLPVAENEFILENMSGFKMIFEKTDSGKVTDVISSQPNGEFKADKIK